jgi:hypothetical protein
MKRRANTPDAGDVLLSLNRPISPPIIIRKNRSTHNDEENKPRADAVTIEDGSETKNHLEFYCYYLEKVTIQVKEPRLNINDFRVLFLRNSSQRGHHFVIHQHDHPIAGTHYDLRLQINATSSVSWAIMYGLPGNPNSRKPNRNATETRVHCLWVSKVKFVITVESACDISEPHIFHRF